MPNAITSDALLNEILLVVQNILKEQDEMKRAVDAINSRIDSLIKDGFVDGDLKRHKHWHLKRDIPAWRRAIIRMLS